MIVKKYDANLIRYISLFERITGVRAKDCFVLNNTIVFFVEPGKAGRAVGREGKNIRSIHAVVKKDVRIIEFASDPLRLASNFVYPLKPDQLFISETDRGKKIINIKFSTAGERRNLLSNNQERLKELKDIMRRYHKDVENILVLQ